MQYLQQNLGRACLPYDAMRHIYEYANPLHNLQTLLNSKDYILKNKMWLRMVAHIRENVRMGGFFWLICNTTGRNVSFTPENIHTVTDPEYAEILLHGAGGYCSYFFFKTMHVKTLCGMDTRFTNLNYHMRKQLEYKYPKRDFRKHTRKQLFKWWRRF
jgi:hypothetical protein